MTDLLSCLEQDTALRRSAPYAFGSVAVDGFGRGTVKAFGRGGVKGGPAGMKEAGFGRGPGRKSGTQDTLETFQRALGSLHQLGFTANVIDVDLAVGVVDDLPAFGEADEVIIDVFKWVA